MTPLTDRVLILPDKPKQISTGGILLPDMHEPPKNQGTVVAMGNGVSDDFKEHVKIGDRVIHNRMEAYDPGKIELDGVMHYLMREKDVLGVFV